MHFTKKYIAFYLEHCILQCRFAMHINIKIMETITKKKSESLTKTERKALREFRKQFDTDVKCAGKIGIDRNVLTRVMLAGSGAPDTIEKIRAAISDEVTTNEG